MILVPLKILVILILIFFLFGLPVMTWLTVLIKRKKAKNMQKNS